MSEAGGPGQTVVCPFAMASTIAHADGAQQWALWGRGRCNSTTRRRESGPACSPASFERGGEGSDVGEGEAHIAVRNTGVEELGPVGLEAQPGIEVEGVGLGGQLHRRMAEAAGGLGDRKSTRLNSSHVRISYAVFCLKKKKI